MATDNGKFYVGVNSVAQTASKIYLGVNGVAKCVYDSAGGGDPKRSAGLDTLFSSAVGMAQVYTGGGNDRINGKFEIPSQSTANGFMWGVNKPNIVAGNALTTGGVTYTAYSKELTFNESGDYLVLFHKGHIANTQESTDSIDCHFGYQSAGSTLVNTTLTTQNSLCVCLKLTGRTSEFPYNKYVRSFGINYLFGDFWNSGASMCYSRMRSRLDVNTGMNNLGSGSYTNEQVRYYTENNGGQGTGVPYNSYAGGLFNYVYDLIVAREGYYLFLCIAGGNNTNTWRYYFTYKYYYPGDVVPFSHYGPYNATWWFYFGT